MFARPLASLLLVLSAPAPPARPPAPEARPLFEFHSDFWVNLHHFLYVTARARKGVDSTDTAETASLTDTVGISRLTPDQRAAWEAALGYYTRELADHDVISNDALMQMRATLCHVDPDGPLPTTGLPPGAAAALQDAAPVYRAIWWARHDASNRAWIDAMRPLVAQHGAAMARMESRAFRMTWRAPIRVDVAAYTNWAGAYTLSDPPLIAVSSLPTGFHGRGGLEIIFHESLHTMEDSVATALRRAERAAAKPERAAALHALIFYTAGEAARRAFGPDYTPIATALGMWSKFLRRYHSAIETSWQPYLDGRATFEAAIAGVVAGS
jgi:hypothetical protein